MTTDPTDDRHPADGGMWLNGAPIDRTTGGRALAPQARTVKLVASSVLALPVILGVVVVALGGLDGGDLQLVPTLLPVAVGLFVAVGITTIGMRVQPLDPGVAGPAAESVALQRFTTSFFLRFALAEMPALVALALTFAFPPVSVLAYAPGGVMSLLLMFLFVRPSPSGVGKIERALDERGGRSNLSAAFGY